MRAQGLRKQLQPAASRVEAPLTLAGAMIFATDRRFERSSSEESAP